MHIYTLERARYLTPYHPMNKCVVTVHLVCVSTYTHKVHHNNNNQHKLSLHRVVCGACKVFKRGWEREVQFEACGKALHSLRLIRPVSHTQHTTQLRRKTARKDANSHL